jgi:hypothetical protein
MDYRPFAGRKLWIVRLDPGEDVLLSLKRFIRENGIQQGAVVSGYGTLSKVSLHWVTHNRFPTNNKFEEWEGGIEVTGVNGMIVGGEPHIHFTASTPQGAFGGHLEEGCICYVLLEVVIVELEGPGMARVTRTIAVDENGRSVQGPRIEFS